MSQEWAQKYKSASATVLFKYMLDILRYDIELLGIEDL